MKKSTKGAIAAVAAGVLLLGGLGSLAYWTADGDAAGGSIKAGNLTLTDGVCGDDWVYAADSEGAGTPVNLFVPGDNVSQECTFVVGATGDNLSATVEVPETFTPTADPTGTSAKFDVSGAFAIDGTNARVFPNGGTVTSEDDGATITATIDVEIPYGTDETGTPIVNGNDMQDLTATFADLTVTLTQDNPN